jgi:hypothetical protein
MLCDEPQHLPGDVAGAAEHDNRPLIAHRDCLRQPFAEADAREQEIAELAAIGNRVDRGDARSRLNDVDTDLIVRCRTGDHRRLDAEFFAQQFRAAPCRDGVVRAQHESAQAPLIS